MRKEQGKKRGRISFTIHTINIIPLVIFGAVIMLLGTHWFTRTMESEIKGELEMAADNALMMLDIAYPGDYHLEGDRALSLYKGPVDITVSYDIFDTIKNNTGLELTLFYDDTRVLTTIVTDDKRIIGTGAPDEVYRSVYTGGESMFYSKAYINNHSYFSYYMPVKNSDGTIVGMMAVGKPGEKVNSAIHKSVYPLVIADLFAIIFTGIILSMYTDKLIGCLLKIHGFLTEVSSGNLNAELDRSVLSRGDELGDIGRSALVMQRSLRAIVEQDPLTELFNRRSADRKLKQIVKKSETQDTPYSIAMGDIDFFKNVNDTYGHDAGDMVLKSVAEVLRANMRNSGFVSRWGGEEFLLVFDHDGEECARQVLEKILDEIRAMEVSYEEKVIRVTMTFGIAQGHSSVPSENTIKKADDKLYVGKQTGRNRII